MIHRWNGYSQTSVDNTDIAIKVNYSNHCTSDDFFMVLTIEDSAGNVLWSNYILIIRNGFSFEDPDDQVELRKTEFCTTTNSASTIQATT